MISLDQKISENNFSFIPYFIDCRLNEAKLDVYGFHMMALNVYYSNSEMEVNNCISFNVSPETGIRPRDRIKKFPRPKEEFIPFILADDIQEYHKRTLTLLNNLEEKPIKRLSCLQRRYIKFCLLEQEDLILNFE